MCVFALVFEIATDGNTFFESITRHNDFVYYNLRLL